MQAVLGLTFPLPDVFGKDFSSETKALCISSTSLSRQRKNILIFQFYKHKILVYTPKHNMGRQMCSLISSSQENNQMRFETLLKTYCTHVLPDTTWPLLFCTQVTLPWKGYIKLEARHNIHIIFIFRSKGGQEAAQVHMPCILGGLNSIW